MQHKGELKTGFVGDSTWFIVDILNDQNILLLASNAIIVGCYSIPKLAASFQFVALSSVDHSDKHHSVGFTPKCIEVGGLV